MAKNHPRVRDVLIAQGMMMHVYMLFADCCFAGVVSLLLEQMTDTVTVPFLKKITMLLSILCGATHPDGDLPQWELISSAGVKLVFLLCYCPDEDVLVHTAIALSYLLPGVNDAHDVLRKLAEMAAYVYYTYIVVYIRVVNRGLSAIYYVVQLNIVMGLLVASLCDTVCVRVACC